MTSPGADSPLTDQVDACVDALRAGHLVAIPTETVYGLGADAENATAVRRIFQVKGRPADHPLIVHLAHAGLIHEGWARDVPSWAQTLADTIWPGPLTLILQRGARVSDVITGGLSWGISLGQKGALADLRPLGVASFVQPKVPSQAFLVSSL